MQEMFNKDLEQIKKSQSIMNYAITEIISTPEGTDSITTKAENRIGEVEDRMMEINEAESKKEKRIKRNEDKHRDPGTMSNTLHLNHRSPRRRRQKERP